MRLTLYLFDLQPSQHVSLELAICEHELTFSTIPILAAAGLF